MHGHGEHYFATGEKYSGQWINDNKEGQGTSTNADGVSWSGPWVADKPHGKGIATYPSGKIESIEYKKGKIVK